MNSGGLPEFDRMLHGFGIPMLEISFDLVHRIVSIAYAILERCTTKKLIPFYVL